MASLLRSRLLVGGLRQPSFARIARSFHSKPLASSSFQTRRLTPVTSSVTRVSFNRFFSEQPDLENPDAETQAKLDAMKAPPLDGETVVSPKVEALVNSVLELNMMEVMEFMSTLQQRLGIPDELLNPQVGVAAAPAASAEDGDEAAAPAATEKIAFNVKLTSLGSGRVKVMKEIRTLTGFGLKEVQALANNLPAEVGQNLDKEKAEKWAEALRKAGAEVEVE